MKNRRKLRENLMGEEERALAERYRRYYLDAWQDKARRGLPERFALYDAYWEGDVNLPETENDPGSSTNIVHANVEGQVSLLLEQSIGILPVPVTPEDAPFAQSVQKVLEFVKDKNRLTRKLDLHERRREKYGTGIFRVSFSPDALGGAGLPVIEACNPKDIFIDPGICDVYRTEEAAFIIETVCKTVHWARQQYGDTVADAIVPGYRPQYEGDSAGDDTYLHMLVWTKEEGKLRLVEMTGCGLILSDSFRTGQENFYPGGRYPYFFTPLYYREGSVWGKGDVELLIPVQDLINDLDDQIRINARLTGNPQRLIETGSGIDLDAMTNEAGLNIPTTSVSAVRNLEAPPLPSYILQRRDTAMRYESQRITRFSDQMTGAKQAGVQTAAEAAVLHQSGQMSIQHKKLLLQETLSEVFAYCLEMIRAYWTEEVAIRLTDKPSEFVFFRGSDLQNIPARDGKRKDAAFDLIVTVGAGLPTNKTAAYQMMSDLHSRGLVTAEEVRAFLTEYLGFPLKDGTASAAPATDERQKNVENADVEGLTEQGNVKRTE
ncbi:MAG: hypothetical protein E7408_01150 [Ruminococcaceae bacterium]|nr:hypothetical protein [Oscillospiraceae bacterium]